MPKRRSYPSRDEILKQVGYDAETGIFIRCTSLTNSVKLGDVAGGKGARGYWEICINGESFAAHRLAWVIMTGEQPPPYIDHINGDGLDNRWCNLRQATQSQNLANRPAQKNNSLGLKGVSRHQKTGKYTARICSRGTRLYLGLHETPEKAHAAYREAAQKFFGEYARS